MTTRGSYLRLSFHPKDANTRHDFFLELAAPPESLAIRDKLQIEALQTRRKDLFERLEELRPTLRLAKELEIADMLEQTLEDQPWVIPAEGTQINHIIYVTFKQGPDLLTDKYGFAGAGIMSPCTFEGLVRFREERIPSIFPWRSSSRTVGRLGLVEKSRGPFCLPFCIPSSSEWHIQQVRSQFSAPILLLSDGEVKVFMSIFDRWMSIRLASSLLAQKE